MFNNILKIFILYISTIKAQDCFLTVPNDPLNTGLFIPWFVDTNPISDKNCSQLIEGSEVFVESTIFDIDNNSFFVYYPLVIDINTVPAIQPVFKKLPNNNIVIIHIGINGNSVTLLPTLINGTNSLNEGNCINGLYNGTLFGQFAYCNAVNFFGKVNEHINKNLLTIPPILNSTLGDSCPTTRSFSIVDQDQSDNVLSQYIITEDLKVAQDTQFNRNCLKVLKIIANGSDNRLLSVFVAPAIGCNSFTSPNFIDNSIQQSSVALNEIQASIEKKDIALIPPFNPMVLDNNLESIIKINLYRDGVNQPHILKIYGNEDINYCLKMAEIAPPFLILHQNELISFNSPSKMANNLLNFLAERFQNSWENLKCQVLVGINSPIIAIIDPNTGIAISNNLITTSTSRSTSSTTTSITSTTSRTTPSTTSSGQITIYTSTTIPSSTTITSTIIPTSTTPIQPTTIPIQTTIPNQLNTTPIQPTIIPINNTFLCGNRVNNINCTEPCPSGLNSDCITPGFQCFDIINIDKNCNIFNFCGNDVSLNCNETCIYGTDVECKTPGYKCLKDNIKICSSNNSTVNNLVPQINGSLNMNSYKYINVLLYSTTIYILIVSMIIS